MRRKLHPHNFSNVIQKNVYIQIYTKKSNAHKPPETQLALFIVPSALSYTLNSMEQETIKLIQKRRSRNFFQKPIFRAMQCNVSTAPQLHLEKCNCFFIWWQLWNTISKKLATTHQFTLWNNNGRTRINELCARCFIQERQFILPSAQWHLWLETGCHTIKKSPT